MPDQMRVVISSFPNAEAAELWVKTLVGERHAACGSVSSGAVSIYWWNGALERAEEVLVLLKTTERRVPELLTRAAEIHPYDVPELLVLPVHGGASAYMDWVRAEVDST